MKTRDREAGGAAGRRFLQICGQFRERKKERKKEIKEREKKRGKRRKEGEQVGENDSVITPPNARRQLS